MFHEIFEDSQGNSHSVSNGGGNDSFSSVRFSGAFSSVRFSGNDGAYIDRIPAPAYCHHFGSSSNRALIPSGE